MAKPPKKKFPGKSGKTAESRPFAKGRGNARDGHGLERNAERGSKGGKNEGKAGGKPARKSSGQEQAQGRGHDSRRSEGRTSQPHGGPRQRPARQNDSVQDRPKQPRLRADLFGFHAVREAWKNPKRYVHTLYITEGALREFEADLATEAKRPAPTIVTKDDLDRAFPPGTVHQGIALSAQPLEEVALMDIIIAAKDKPKSVIVILDQVTDPHNVGAIMRSACAFGASGIVMQSRHAPESVGILAKIASGAVEHLAAAYETNLSRTIDTLKDHGYTVIGMDEHAPKGFTDLPSYEKAVIVLGAEGPGMRRLIKEHCDVLVTLPTQKPINSLNVSNAAAVALYALTA